MQAVVEWGRPKCVLEEGAPCGVSGFFVCENAKKAAELAIQMCHVHREHKPMGNTPKFDVSKDQPRIVWWSSEHDFWIAVSILDGKPRGSYAWLADKAALDLKGDEG